MADVMIAVTPFHGHAAPMAAVAAAFVEAGHAVRVYTGAAYAARFEAVGAEVVRWRSAPDFDEHDLASTFPALAGRKGPRQLLRNVEHLFVRTGAAQTADLLAAYEARPWDVVVAESTSLGAALAAESTGTPWATIALTPLALPSTALPPPGLGLRPARGSVGRLRDRLLHRVVRSATKPIQRAYAEQRLAVGLQPPATTFDEACYSPRLICANGVAELEYPRPEASDRVRFVGRLARPDDDGLERPGWWHEVVDAAVPVVHVTQGTQNLDPHDLIEPSLGALAGMPVLAVVSTGRREDAALPFPLPANARAAGLLPHSSLLPHCAAMITNGGWGGVLAALAADVPLVVAGGDIDKPEAAARVAWAGAGVDLRTGRPSARAVAGAVRRLSRDPAYRVNARAIGRALRAHDGPREVVEHTMRMLRGGRRAKA